MTWFLEASSNLDVLSENPTPGPLLTGLEATCTSGLLSIGLLNNVRRHCVTRWPWAPVLGSGSGRAADLPGDSPSVEIAGSGAYHAKSRLIHILKATIVPLGLMGLWPCVLLLDPRPSELSPGSYLLRPYSSEDRIPHLRPFSQLSFPSPPTPIHVEQRSSGLDASWNRVSSYFNWSPRPLGQFCVSIPSCNLSPSP